LSIRHRSGESRCKFADAELIDFVGKIGKKLIGSKTAARGWRRPGVLRNWFRLGWSNGVSGGR